jgi:quercetin dioxygenase-like cupin family protein
MEKRNLSSMIEFPKEGIYSKVVADTPKEKVVIFAMPEGEYLSPHTSAMEATVYTIAGNANWTVGEESFTAEPSDWFLMPENTLHSVKAATPYVFLLTLHK